MIEMDDRYYMMGRYRQDVEDVEKNNKEKERGAHERGRTTVRKRESQGKESVSV